MRKILAALVLAASLTSCRPTDTVTVAVFGDSLAPIADYRAAAEARGWDIDIYATGGSWMCGGHGLPQTDEGRWWPRIMQVIREDRPDYVILHYQAWANYQLRCGGRPVAFPYSRSDPGQGWRVYLDMFRQAGARLVVVGSAGVAPGKTAWIEPQAIMEQAGRTMAARHPEVSFVPIRHLFGSSAFVRCATVDGPGCWSGWRSPDWPSGQVRWRSGDGVHYWCPSGGGVCAGSSPAGRRIAGEVFAGLPW
jgi:hypothetical protein